MGASGCRGYVYLQIKPSVPKQYLPGLFRYTSAVKPWVQPSLYCVNLPSFREDSISFPPPPNTPIHIPHSLCTANKQDVAIDGGNIAGNKCLCSVFLRDPPVVCDKPRKSRGIKGAQTDDTKSGGKTCKRGAADKATR